MGPVAMASTSPGQRLVDGARHILVGRSTARRRDLPRHDRIRVDRLQVMDETAVRKQPAELPRDTVEHASIAEDEGVAHRPHVLVGEKFQAQLGSDPRGVAHRDRDTRQTHAIILRGLRQWHGQLGAAVPLRSWNWRPRKHAKTRGKCVRAQRAQWVCPLTAGLGRDCSD